MKTHQPLSAEAVAAALRGTDEVALIDVRDKGEFVTGHLWLAVNIPYAKIELRIRRFVPRSDTRVILCDANGELVERASRVLREMGYTELFSVELGVNSWEEAELPLVNGDYVIAHSFGFHIEELYKTPVITAGELRSKLEAGDDVIIIDARDPLDYERASLPGSISVPAAEVVQRVPDLVLDENTQIVVHCAGVTRAALGAQTLINAKIPNPVTSLLHGTKGWFLEAGELVGNQFAKLSESSANAKKFAKKTATNISKKIWPTLSQPARFAFMEN